MSIAVSMNFARAYTPTSAENVPHLISMRRPFSTSPISSAILRLAGAVSLAAIMSSIWAPLYWHDFKKR